MALPRFSVSLGEGTHAQVDFGDEGFAVVSLLTLVPLLATTLICLGAALFAMKRKTLAQAICIQQASRLQDDLKSPLRKILKMNPRAEFLRAKRRTADNNLQAANASGYPPAIAAAQAADEAVVLEQVEFHSRQLALLAEADAIRSSRQREMHERATHVQGMGVTSQIFYPQALAVEPKPPYDLSPNYETVPGFKFAQQQRFSFNVDVLALFPRPLDIIPDSIQKINCSVSLAERSGDWEIEILAARAP